MALSPGGTEESPPSDIDENDDHFRLFHKKWSETRYTDEVCQFCKTRIDEIGWCACDTIGGG